MLVISRAAEQSLVFPALGIRVHILKVNAKAARLGIEAPPEIQVLRGELFPGELPLTTALTQQQTITHDLRNRLNRLILAFHMASQLRQANKEAEAFALLQDTLAEVEQLDGERVEEPAQQPSAVQPIHRPRTLLVEDQQNERELLAGLLRMHGCDCDTASDGQQALDYLAVKVPPDIVLLDMWMPRCDGVATVKAIRTNPQWRGVRIFSISCTSPEELGLVQGPQGIDAWFPKPLNPRRLCDSIQKAMLIKQ